MSKNFKKDIETILKYIIDGEKRTIQCSNNSWGDCSVQEKKVLVVDDYIEKKAQIVLNHLYKIPNDKQKVYINFIEEDFDLIKDFTQKLKVDYQYSENRSVNNYRNNEDDYDYIVYFISSEITLVSSSVIIEYVASILNASSKNGKKIALCVIEKENVSFSSKDLTSLSQIVNILRDNESLVFSSMQEIIDYLNNIGE